MIRHTGEAGEQFSDCAMNTHLSCDLTCASAAPCLCPQFHSLSCLVSSVLCSAAEPHGRTAHLHLRSHLRRHRVDGGHPLLLQTTVQPQETLRPARADLVVQRPAGRTTGGPEDGAGVRRSCQVLLRQDDVHAEDLRAEVERHGRVQVQVQAQTKQEVHQVTWSVFVCLR